jgi:hypothetical protein
LERNAENAIRIVGAVRTIVEGNEIGAHGGAHGTGAAVLVAPAGGEASARETTIQRNDVTVPRLGSAWDVEGAPGVIIEQNRVRNDVTRE